MSGEVEETQSVKLEIIKYYYNTKGGVDTINTGSVHAKRRTLRWLLAFFYNMIDGTGLACSSTENTAHGLGQRINEESF